MNQIYKIVATLLLLIILSACARRAVQISGDQVNIQNEKPFQRFYLFGNVGVNDPDSPAAFDAMLQHINENSKKDDYLLLLGDNVLANSIRKDDEDNKDANQFKKQLEQIAKIDINTLVLPGDHDWNDEGMDGLKKIEEFTEEYLDNDEAFQPENACPLEELNISDQVEMLIVDSQWYIEDWDKNPNFNDECEINTREKFIKVLADELRKARHKTIILAMHHPLYTNGVHGGQLGMRMVTTPKQENAYIPGLGFAYSFVRSQAGLFPQDRYNPLMNDLMREIETAGSGIDRLLVVSSHEESLQYIDRDNIKQVVSGATVSQNIVSLGKKGKFAAGKIGFSEVRVFEDQSSQVLFYLVDEQGNLEQVYSNKLFDEKKPYDIDGITVTNKDAIAASIYSKEETEMSAKDEEFYGKHYRELYGIDVKAPVVMLDTLYGGLRVERAGGGNQTQGLRLIGKGDREYNMRALEKDALQFLKSAGFNELDAERYFGETLPQELIRDFYTSAHPYGAFAVPRLAGAIKLNHTHPKLFWIPKQPVLGDFNDIHGDRLYMIVEKPDDSFDSPHMFGYNKDVESTDDLFAKIREDEKYTVDEEMYIRARVFDMLLGDWDRHEDQWRWAEIKDSEDSEKSRFVAVPRDRDQVFARFDGKLLEFLNSTIGVTKQFGNYGPDIEHINEFSQSAKYLDHAVLQRTTREDWLTAVNYIQKNIDENVVKMAFNEMPKEVKDDLWQQTQEDLLARKSNLENIVNRYYDNFILFQTLKGTDKDDIFFIERLDKETTVKAYRNKDGEAADVLFERSFKDNKTEEIWIYGLDDDDEFTISGSGNSKIQIVIVGGKGDDKYTIENGKNVKIYDFESEKNEVEKRNGASVVLRDDYDINHYNHRKAPTSKLGFGAQVTYNPDDGVRPQISISKSVLGYERNPYSLKYGIEADYRSLTQAAIFQGHLAKANILGHWNLRADALITTNNYTQNFFGYGNNTTFDGDTDFDDNRVLMQRQEASLSIYKHGDYGSDFQFGIQYRGIEVEPDITRSALIDNQRDDYLDYTFKYLFDSYDNERFKTRGMHLENVLSFTDNLANGENFLSIDPSLTFWNALDDERKLIVQSRVAGQLRIGDEPVFYQAARLGADRGLRSYRQDRFTGNYAANASLDLKYDARPIKTKLLPLYWMPFIGVDAGRVWITGESSDRIHYSYGGGAHLSLTGLGRIEATYFHGPEGGRLGVGLFLGF
ncbi:metallophosphoesterase [Nonlabens ponticola]|uniref:Calcineurin-like phosphoesterase domain-containing protein n=1 Tax=Nonlabens ponticola TaxID=2496866 RepID=A0A3S9MYP9_9FLAO|nr:metallophosphoesterase [Nonlabens ponticola]AZQ44279.1 hypothetical protein EJ995_08535 [Nonlabens ponticola]